MKYHRQETKDTCGPACMRMALGMLGIKKSEKSMARLLKTDNIYGTLNKNFPLVAKKYSLTYRSSGMSTTSNLKSLMKQGYVVIVCYFIRKEREYHYAVVRKIGARHIHLYDPWFGPRHAYTTSHFMRIWKGNRSLKEADRWFFALRKHGLNKL
ncbi:MAG: C39 family peptidase [Candidatus Aenigmarchaeota archaeon]|nr:C39 family peptidase [Candidatus Aenigmarchaeota archaeon]